MRTKNLYLLWLYSFILCAALGFIPTREVWVTVLLTLVSLAFFLPPALLLYRGVKESDPKPLRTILVVAVASLLLTMVLFIAYWYALTASGSDLTANIVYCALTILSTPMMCAPVPALSMFLWACLIFTAIHLQKKLKK